MHQREKKNRNRNDTTVHEGTYKTCILQANSGFSSLKLCMNHTVYCLPFTAQSTYQLHLQHVPNMIGLETWIDSPRIPHTSTFSTFGNKQLQTCLSCWIYAVTSPGLRKKNTWTFGLSVWTFWLPNGIKWYQLDLHSTNFACYRLAPLILKSSSSRTSVSNRNVSFKLKDKEKNNETYSSNVPSCFLGPFAFLRQRTGFQFWSLHSICRKATSAVDLNGQGCRCRLACNWSMVADYIWGTVKPCILVKGTGTRNEILMQSSANDLWSPETCCVYIISPVLWIYA